MCDIEIHQSNPPGSESPSLHSLPAGKVRVERALRAVKWCTREVCICVLLASPWHALLRSRHTRHNE